MPLKLQQKSLLSYSAYMLFFVPDFCPMKMIPPVSIGFAFYVFKGQSQSHTFHSGLLEMLPNVNCTERCSGWTLHQGAVVVHPKKQITVKCFAPGVTCDFLGDVANKFLRTLQRLEQRCHG